MMNLIEYIQMIDTAAMMQIYLAGGNSFLDFAAVLLSYLGTFRAGAILLAIIFALKKETRPLIFILAVALLASSGTTGIIKDIVARPRPYVELGLGAADILIQVRPYVSFPSGHTATAFTTAAVAAYYFRKWAVPLFLAACIAGLARIYLLVHYPSDVIAGAAIGIAVAAIVIYVFERERRRAREDDHFEENG
ncbi:hypothetical protein MmiEs2_10090 [Methanimicrococcus stummii]|uniref:Phosphatidic acid phosphatase type 2/haloperoxidase domain-containing protein n=1 Tax=Methanimicrococcus stummii TaxID=3028294 RepID=A0AA96VIA8_9EURY|nr:phosphatase PAP2 family protein [Methanimicrococcus sp. Es2]WNY28801.1 hypothetical protein MmiEs2_10090 [Methanimicrococcus sp. Es2]